ncbi:hypothetical protein CFC21_096153 [Triticum aestivum]|uniref:DUF569 domain-containing protein n=3 Tax=Triticum TaxID=4564 RepID=A0A9R1BJ34_TRITD|nr:uncharacterized protein LOC123152329 [Triticum aestivum]KAF7093761.1 hypothetical protein CFC21_096153 [Triticum aestivum]VAI70467.1 unnamed protein product [Triticum turgidum subsp. durum]
MEQFQDGHHVRLRSRERGTYLHADDDGLGVSLRRNRASMNAAWAVHVYQGDGNNQYVLLHSAAYGRYLGATDVPARRGHSGRRVEQCDYEPWEEMAIRWQVVRIGSGDDILLRQAVAGRLRANGRYLSVDAFNSVGPMMHWVVEQIPAREDTPHLAAPTGLRFPRSLAFLLPWRVIQYEQAGAGEPNANFAWNSFLFRGRSVFHLRKKLARRLDAAMDASNLVMCVRAGTQGRPTPLLVDLPHSDETLDIIVVMAGTPAHADLRYPNVNAE